MKKILSLVLAVAMLSTTAFAAIVPTLPDGKGDSSVNPGKTISIGAAEFKYTVTKDNATTTHNLATELTETDAEMNSINFSITKKSFSKGAALVKSVGFNDEEGTLEIKLNTNYELAAPDYKAGKAANLIIEDIVVTSKKALKNDANETIVGRSTKYNYFGEKKVWVGYQKLPQDITNGSAEYKNDRLVEFDGDAYGDATLTEGDVTIEGRVYDGDKVYLNVDNKIGDDQKAVLKNNENADLRFYNVTTNGLPSNNTILLYVEEDQFVYEIADGKLVKSSMTWNKDEYAFKGKIRSDKKYVVSDIELKATSTGTAGSENPDTGANDVVGVAAALAVISLVAAGAVSLKK